MDWIPEGFLLNLILFVTWIMKLKVWSKQAYWLPLLKGNKETVDIAGLNKEEDLSHLGLVYLSEDFRSGKNQDDLINYL